MSSSSIVIESKDVSESRQTRDHRVIVPTGLPGENKKFEAIKNRTYRHITESIRSSVVVFACLALYKITGAHAWWIRFVHNFLVAP